MGSLKKGYENFQIINVISKHVKYFFIIDLL